MKKIRLNVANLDATEILSRDQLKSIFGGSGSVSGSSSDLVNCDSSDDIGKKCIKSTTTSQSGVTTITYGTCTKHVIVINSMPIDTITCD